VKPEPEPPEPIKAKPVEKKPLPKKKPVPTKGNDLYDDRG
jgi:hypothetical protein